MACSVKSSGKILLGSMPTGINVEDVKHDLEMVGFDQNVLKVVCLVLISSPNKIPGVISVHELHIWLLNQEKAMASVHVTISKETVSEFAHIAKIMTDCFHGYGVHSATVQPELRSPITLTPTPSTDDGDEWPNLCQLKCGTSCQVLTCCG